MEYNRHTIGGTQQFNDPCIISPIVVELNGDEGTWSVVWRLIFNILLRT